MIFKKILHEKIHLIITAVHHGHFLWKALDLEQHGGGELTGVPVGKVWNEPTPYNMVLVSRGAYNMGPGEIDSLWGGSPFPPGGVFR